MLLNARPLLTATIHEPIEGRWWADVSVAGTDALDTTAALSLLGGDAWRGTVVEQGPDGSRVRARVLGGGARGNAPVTDRYYRGSVTLQAVMRDMLAEAGETLDPDSAGLSRQLSTWQRFAGPLHEALADIAHAQRLAWRVTRAGLVRLLDLPHTFPASEPAGTLTEDDGRALVLAMRDDGARPGATIAGRQVHRVTWEATAQRLTAVCHYHDVPEQRRVQDHRTIAEAGVDAQRADGSLDVIAASRYGLTEVPLYAGLPGCTVRVRPGTQTLVAYAGGPRRPVAIGHRGGSGGLKLGTLVGGQHPTSMVVAPPQFFPAGPVGDAAAVAAAAALASAGVVPHVTPITTTTVEEQ